PFEEQRGERTVLEVGAVERRRVEPDPRAVPARGAVDPGGGQFLQDGAGRGQGLFLEPVRRGAVGVQSDRAARRGGVPVGGQGGHRLADGGGVPDRLALLRPCEPLTQSGGGGGGEVEVVHRAVSLPERQFRHGRGEARHVVAEQLPDLRRGARSGGGLTGGGGPQAVEQMLAVNAVAQVDGVGALVQQSAVQACRAEQVTGDRKSTRLNSSHVKSSYAAFCLQKKNL